MALLVALVIPAMALGGLCAKIQKTPPTGMFLEQVRHTIAEQAHQQEHLHEPLRIDTIHKYFGKDAWHVIWAEPQDYEMGVFVIASEGDRLRHVTLWGGAAFLRKNRRFSRGWSRKPQTRHGTCCAVSRTTWRRAKMDRDRRLAYPSQQRTGDPQVQAPAIELQAMRPLLRGCGWMLMTDTRRRSTEDDVACVFQLNKANMR